MTAEKPEKKTKTATVLDYNAFLRSLKLHTINLKEATCDIDRKAYWDHKERNLAYKMMANAVDVGDNYFDVRAKVEVTITGVKPKAHIISIIATFDVHFHAEAFSKALVEQFCNSELRLIVWPYFREYVSDVSSRMYVPPLILPLSNEQEE